MLTPRLGSLPGRRPRSEGPVGARSPTPPGARHSTVDMADSTSPRTRPHRERLGSQRSESPAARIDAMIRELRDWRGDALSRLRTVIKHAAPGVVEEVKWKKPSNPDGVPVWSCNGILCLGNVWKDHVRLTFSRGAFLEDPSRLFNASLQGRSLRALDLREGQTFDEDALMALIRAAVALNAASAARR